MSRIFAFCGAMGAGKSESAKYLLRKAEGHTLLMKFAQPMYDIQKFVYERVHKDLPVTKDRKLLQFLGGDWGRGLSPNLWSDLWELNYRHYRMFAAPRNFTVVVDDLRYDNEAIMLGRYDTIFIKVVANRDARAARIDLTGEGDKGEAGIDPLFINETVVNNGSLEDLYKQIDWIYEKYSGNNKG